MLTQDAILTYVKTNLGYPYSSIEIFDDDFVKYFNTITIRDFSMEYPDIATIRLNRSEYINKTSERSCEIYDPDGREIIDVQDIIGGFNQFNVPMGSVPDHIMEKLIMLKTQKLVGQYEITKFTFEYMHPNTIIFEGRYPDEATVVYQRVHLFESVKPKMEIHLRDLCLADAKIIIGATRKNIKTIPTPIGDIDIDPEIGNEGKQLREDIMTNLRDKIAINKFIEVI